MGGLVLVVSMHRANLLLVHSLITMFTVSCGILLRCLTMRLIGSEGNMSVELSTP